MKTDEEANGNCSDEGGDRDESEAEQNEGAEMVVDRQSSPGPEACDDVRPERLEEQHAIGGVVAEERHTEQASEEQRKVSHEPANKCEDEEANKDAELLKALKPRIDAVKQKLAQATKGFGVFRLEMLHASISRLLQHGRGESCTSRLESLEAFVADESNLPC